MSSHPTGSERGGGAPWSGDIGSLGSKSGSITGNIMGALIGSGKIPRKYFDRVELRDLIVGVACDLYDGGPECEYDHDAIWDSKYLYGTYLYCGSTYE